MNFLQKIKVTLLIIGLNLVLTANAQSTFNIIGSINAFLEENLQQFMRQNPEFSRYELFDNQALNYCFCEQPIKISLINPDLKTANLRLKVNCPNNWQTVIKFRLNLYQQVLISKKHIKRGEILKIDDFRQIEKKYNAGNNQIITNIPAHQVAAKNIAKDTILRASMLKEQTLIYRGNQVKVIIKNDDLYLTVLAIALNNGAAGESIKLRNLTSNKIINAKVITAEYAQIDTFNP